MTPFLAGMSIVLNAVFDARAGTSVTADAGVMAQPLTALVVAASDDHAAVERTVAALSANSVVPGLHVEHLSVPIDQWLREFASRFPGRDLVCVSAGVEMPFAWDARLAKAAHADPCIAAAVP